MKTDNMKIYRITMMMLASSTFAVLLLIIRMLATSTPSYIFLAWNLVLAWVPFAAALVLSHYEGRRFRWPGMVALLGFWLLFLPNSPYLVTDFLHLRPRPGVPFWFDASLLTVFAWNGLLLGFTSIRLVHRFLEERFGKRLSSWSLVLIFLMCSFGVYLGRFERWNSWDILSNPFALAADVFSILLNPFDNPRMIGVTLLFFTFMCIGYFSISAIGKLHTNPKQ